MTWGSGPHIHATASWAILLPTVAPSAERLTHSGGCGAWCPPPSLTVVCLEASGGSHSRGSVFFWGHGVLGGRGECLLLFL